MSNDLPQFAKDIVDDARRFRALVEIGKLSVAREKPGGFTCWLELPEICFRSQSEDPRVIADMLAEFLIELKPKV